MKRFPLLLVLLSACTVSTPEPKVSMKISIATSGGVPATVLMNGASRGATPLEMDVLSLPFDPALKPKSWPPPGVKPIEPTESKHGGKVSSLQFAMDGDRLYVRAVVNGQETLGGLLLQVKGADGATLEFELADKGLSSSLGKAEHSFHMVYKRR